ncbi:hypothetical protein [Collinsella tanakaei]
MVDSWLSVLSGARVVGLGRLIAVDEVVVEEDAVDEVDDWLLPSC